MTRARLVVLVSGAGTNLQALIDASKDPQYPADVVAVGSDRPDIEALARAEEAGIPSFVTDVSQFQRRAQWDSSLADHVATFAPDLIVLAGFMKLNGPSFLARFPDRVINTHPALLPSFPGMHGPRDALQHGVTVTGCTIFLVDEGVDTGPIVAQAAVEVMPGDSEEALHMRIKEKERQLLVQTVAKMVTTPYHVVERKVVWS